jgi:hypothetical protein
VSAFHGLIVVENANRDTQLAKAISLLTMSNVRRIEGKVGARFTEHHFADLTSPNLVRQKGLSHPMENFDEPNLSEIWQARADECRAMAQIFRNPETHEKMLKVAENFEKMAYQARQRELSVRGN